MRNYVMLVLHLIFFQYGFAQQNFQLAPPLVRYTTTYVSNGTSVTVLFDQPGAAVYYTLNGDEPNAEDAVYETPIVIQDKAILKLKAIGKNFTASETISIPFVKSGLKIKEAVFSTPNESYAQIPKDVLFDGIGGQLNYRSGAWVGFSNDTVTVKIELQKKEKINKVMIGILQDENSWIFLPQQIKASYFDEQQKKYLPFGNKNFVFDKPGEKQIALQTITTSKPIIVKDIILEFIVVNKIPDWHPGKGNHGWLFLDEINIY